ncbi:MAG: Crp/Fnr family transcriptional regulator [Alphaproteobacteria bacterium]
MTQALSATAFSILGQTPLLRGLPEGAFAALAAASSERFVRRGEVLFLQGAPAEHIWVVIDGWIKIYRTTQGGAEAVMAVFTRGQSFAEAAVFRAAGYPTTAEAATDARVVRVPAAALMRLVRERPEAALAMLASLSQKLHLLIGELEQLKVSGGAQRVAGFLLSLCDGTGDQTVALPYDKALIAAKVGMKPESLSRAFNRLRGLGVRIDGDSVRIADVAGLQSFATETD